MQNIPSILRNCRQCLLVLESFVKGDRDHSFTVLFNFTVILLFAVVLQQPQPSRLYGFVLFDAIAVAFACGVVKSSYIARWSSFAVIQDHRL
ncbi:hypothetical protein RB195_008103 [Necator americanus]|uniref:7TM GPCR serpentine receptor class x (Srx) domain-containing protein n=1 Tax=Necator americanus TaxID=51031 RepID=A0ABR1CN08_NECAM